MTKDEANLTRCCGPEGCGGNSAGEAERFCIADRCMGWRQTHVHKGWIVNDGTRTEEWSWDPRTLKHEYANCTVEREIVEPHGYCGLAGTP